jgi:NADH-quinone oxidoreductase subunit F
MCGLGQSAPNPVLSTIRYFRDEYERHILDKRCDAFVCKELVGAPCQTACPIGTEAWRYVAHLARGEYEEAYRVIRETNPFPSVCARVCDHRCEAHCRLGASGDRPVAIRALKRAITDRVDPSTFKPPRVAGQAKPQRVAVVGSGPAGLTAAHHLSLMGHRVTIFEADDRPGGMLVSGVPSYRLPRDVLQKEIDALLDEKITLTCGSALGRDFTIDRLFADGYRAVFLALGAHRSRRLGIEGEDLEGVYPSMRFLKAYNLGDKKLARGRVGVIGGGNSAVDAARMAMRQEGVDEVTILYRRTRHEMPAFAAEIDAALEEGIKLETLISPAKLHAEGGRLRAVELIRNDLGDFDDSGRRRPVPKDGSEFKLEIDTLIVAIGEQLQTFELDGSAGLEIHRSGRIAADSRSLATGRDGVFAGGDVVTGPNTVIDAIAAGKRAARMIDRYLAGQALEERAARQRPEVYVEPVPITREELARLRRAEPPTISLEQRRRGFEEVELVLTEDAARDEARRCLRCDLDFTRPQADEVGMVAQQSTGAKS